MGADRGSDRQPSTTRGAGGASTTRAKKTERRRTLTELFSGHRWWRRPLPTNRKKALASCTLSRFHLYASPRFVLFSSFVCYPWAWKLRYLCFVWLLGIPRLLAAILVNYSQPSRAHAPPGDLCLPSGLKRINTSTDVCPHPLCCLCVTYFVVPLTAPISPLPNANYWAVRINYYIPLFFLHFGCLPWSPVSSLCWESTKSRYTSTSPFLPLYVACLCKYSPSRSYCFSIHDEVVYITIFSSHPSFPVLIWSVDPFLILWFYDSRSIRNDLPNTDILITQKICLSSRVCHWCIYIFSWAWGVVVWSSGPVFGIFF